MYRTRGRLLSLLPAAVFFLATLFLAPAALAASQFNLTTSPLPVDLSTTPGHTISTVIRVQNSGTQAATIDVSLKKFKANGTNGTPQLLGRETGDSFFDWVSFNKTRFVAQPGQWNEVTMTINPPSSAAFGYYFAVIFSNGQTGASTGNAAQLQGAVATLVLLDVKANGESRNLKVVSFKADKKLYEYLPSTFSIDVKNTGNVHVMPSGSIFITKGGKTIATLDINPGGGNVLPGSDRIFKSAWSDGFPVFEPQKVNGEVVTDSHGQPKLKLNWNFTQANHLRIGHYNAHLTLAYDNGARDVPIEADVSFWVLPWKLLPVAIALLALIGVGLFTSGRGLWRRTTNKLKPRDGK